MSLKAFGLPAPVAPDGLRFADGPGGGACSRELNS